MYRLFARVAVLAGLLTAVNCHAETIIGLDAYIEKAIRNNPQVMASWHALEAAKEEQRSAKGEYYPKVDLISELGRERSESPAGKRDPYDWDSTSLTLTQMLFDSGAAASEVERLGYRKLARFYEFRRAAEGVALEAAKAYLDVLRYRGLVELAKENYVQHHSLFTDIKDRVNSGVGRGVDLDQARARLSLSESNLLTEATNLHDVSVRFQRLVGEFPSEHLLPPSANVDLIPADRSKALADAILNNPQINAAIEQVRAAQSSVRATKAPMGPRFDLRLRKDLNHDLDGRDGRFEEDGVEVVMRYNFYNGGSDSARRRQSFHQLSENEQLREQACREVRQTLSIEHNNIQAQNELVGYLNTNYQSISSARDVYREQFDIGQRTLLDLLDTENEYFETSRTLENARIDERVAQFSTLAAMGRLLQSFGMDQRDAGLADELNKQRSQEVMARCPGEWRAPLQIDKQALLASLVATDNPAPMAAAPMPEKVRRLGEETLGFRLDVKFAYKSTALAESVEQDIEAAASFLKQFPDVTAVIEGHTDSVASEGYNRKLSKARANSVRDRLIEKHGIDPARLKAVGIGEAQPIASNETDYGRSLNRRVEMKLNGQSIRTSTL